MSEFRFYLLGPLEIRSGYQPLLPPPTIKSKSLLAYIILHRTQTLSRDGLAALFWGDRTERKARRSLATALWHIRSCLGDENLLLSDHFTLQVNPEVSLWLDVEEFEVFAQGKESNSLQKAVEHYRGMLLEGYYDDWIINLRYRLETLYLDALNHLMMIHEASGAHSETLSIALRLLENDPLREEAYRTAMRAYCSLGQRNAALALYHKAEVYLRQELGVAPVIETLALYTAIAEGQIKIGQAPDTLIMPLHYAPVQSPRVQDPFEITRTGPFVGREEELSRLLQAWEATLASGRRLVLIEGEAGVGKSRLVEEFATYVRRLGAWILPGQCYAFERYLSYQPIIEALSCLRKLLTEQEWRDFPSWVLVELRRFIPEIPVVDPGSEKSLAGDQMGEQERLFEALVRMLNQIASQRPLVIVLEDLHWATVSTLSLLHYFMRHLADQPVLLVGTIRPQSTNPSALLEELKIQLEKEGSTHSFTLQPFSEQAVVGLLQALSGSGQEILPLARRLFSETEGNPFFLTEIIKALFNNRLLRLENNKWQGDFSSLRESKFPLPGSLRETILSRVNRLDELTRRALHLAAVLGREFDFEPFSILCGQGDDAAVRFLDSLLRSRLIEEGSGVMRRDYAFSHHLIQEVIYEDLPLRTRQQTHGLAGAALERSYSLAESALKQGDPNEPGMILPAELAHHFDQGRLINSSLDVKTVYYQLATGDQARKLYATQEAVHFYQQALAILKVRNDYEQAARTLMKLGLTYHNAFDFPLARQIYQEAFAFWRLTEKGNSLGGCPLPPVPHALRLLAEEPPILDLTRHPRDGSVSVLGALYSGLVQQGPQLEILPDIADEWELSNGGRSYIFHLRKDARWTDGHLVQASDFVAAWKRILGPTNRTETAALLYDIRGAKDYHLAYRQATELGVTALDEATLLVELNDPCGYFLHLMADSVAYPIPAHQVARFGDAWSQPENLVTNGAFRLESWKRGESMLLARNPAYYGGFGGNIQEVLLSFILPWSGGLDLYSENRLDILDISFFQPQDLDAARQYWINDYRCLPRLATGFTGFDTSRPPFDDQRVRQAFALATDRQALASLLRGDQVFPASGGLVPPGMPGHTPGIALPLTRNKRGDCSPKPAIRADLDFLQL